MAGDQEVHEPVDRTALEHLAEAGHPPLSLTDDRHELVARLPLADVDE